MSTHIQVVFYSMYSHIHQMAEAVAAGAREQADTEVELLQVPELMPHEVLDASGARETRATFEHIPLATPEKLTEPDAIIFGAPTRFGNMAAQMRNFLDQLGPHWAQGGYENKIGSVFTSTNSQHGGQETTLTSFHTTLFHLGMIVIGVPYSESRLATVDEVSGGTPYGASTIAGRDGAPSDNEKAIAHYQGRHVAATTAALKAGREALQESSVAMA